MIDELADYLQHEPNKERRRAAYFILGKLGQKFRSADCASVLISHVPNEADKYVLSDLLHALSGVRKPGNLDLTPVFDLLQDERWLVRHSAIQALKQTDSAEAEFQLLRHLDTTNNPYDITYCQSTLNEIGSEKAIPYLEKNLRSRIRDVKMSAQFAIEAIQARRKM
jgi:HEAT repeat protein